MRRPCRSTRIRELCDGNLSRELLLGLTEGESLRVLVGNGILCASPPSESSSEAERDGQERRRLPRRCSWLPWHPQRSFSLVSGWTPAICSGAGGRERAPASFSEIVGEIYFLIYLFFFFNALVVAASSCLRFLSQRLGRTCLKREV